MEDKINDGETERREIWKLITWRDNDKRDGNDRKKRRGKLLKRKREILKRREFYKDKSVLFQDRKIKESGKGRNSQRNKIEERKKERKKERKEGVEAKRVKSKHERKKREIEIVK